MLNTYSKSLLSCLFAAGALIFNGCDTANTSENAAALAAMKTFHMGNVEGGLHNFSTRNMQDVTVLTQEEVARQFEQKGYIEVPLSDPADFSVAPGWSFYEARNRGIRDSDGMNLTLQSNNETRMGRLYVTATSNTGTTLWEGSASWGIQTNINTASDFTQAASLATNSLPNSVGVGVTAPPVNMPPIPQ